jgi:cytochrome c-type biogenesis protein CcmH
MRKCLYGLGLFFSLLAINPLFAQEADLYPFASDAQAKRFASLTQSVRCIVCQNQSLAESDAPLASDLRQKVYHMVQGERSDAEIEAYLVARYGEFILLKPRLSANTFLLWSSPVIVIIMASLFLFLRLRMGRGNG